MKLKDIENRLKKEQDRVEVPDMLSRVKKAPINKLLSGETPAQAFQTKLATRLLVTTAALLIVAVFCFAAMLLFTGNGEATPHCYISLRVQNEQGEQAFDVVISGDVSGAICVANGTDDRIAYTSINALYELKSTDKVTIAAICENREAGEATLKSFREELLSAYDGLGGAAVISTLNDSAEIAAFKARMGDLEDDSLEKLIEKFASEI